VLAALLAIFLLAPGSRQVRHTFFNPTDMWRAFVGDPAKGYYSVGEAIWLNIRMFVAAEILILVLALFVAVIRQSSGPASTRCTAARSRRPARSACRSGPRCGT
jgi:polar amino acid transport system permease protein